MKGKEAVLNMIGETVLSVNNQTHDTGETETDAGLELNIGTVDMSGRQREKMMSWKQALAKKTGRKVTIVLVCRMKQICHRSGLLILPDFLIVHQIRSRTGQAV